jgi:hypothetical protein
MCRRVNCGICGKIGWTGCGAHVDMVMAGVPEDDRCQGHTGEEIARASAQPAASEAASKPWWKR